MSDRDLMFLVSTTILAGTLVVWITQWVRSRNKRDDDHDETDDRP